MPPQNSEIGTQTHPEIQEEQGQTMRHVFKIDRAFTACNW
jgi:hypothetical protein